MVLALSNLMAFLCMGDKGPSDLFVWGLIILFVSFFLELDEVMLGDKEGEVPFDDGLNGRWGI